jgi:hypothetical protein
MTVKKFLEKFPGILLLSIYNKMTNYKQFYNAWHGFAKPKRQLLLERTTIPAMISPDDFLALTTDAEELERIIKNPSVKGQFDFAKMETNPSLSINIDNTGNGKVIEHEGRNRAYAAKLSDIKKIPVDIIVVNKDGVNFKEIEQLIAQFTPVVVEKYKLWTRDASVKADDPLNIGDSESIQGYSIISQYGNEIAGFHYAVMKKMHKQNLLVDFDYGGAAAVLNKAYVVVDSAGNHYTFEKNRLNPANPSRPASLNRVNLSPHPVQVYGSLETANQQTYTIKKK